MYTFHDIDTTSLDLIIIRDIISSDKKLVLSATAIQKIEKCRSFLHAKSKSISKPLCGINKGFGVLYNGKIDDNNLQNLQENLVMSNACGMGVEVPKEIVKLMMLFKI